MIRKILYDRVILLCLLVLFGPAFLRTRSVWKKIVGVGSFLFLFVVAGAVMNNFMGCP